jgi:hypothetical protein
MAVERWLRIEADGRLILHEENDGVVFLRRGPEATEREITLQELQSRYPLLWKRVESKLGEIVQER